jgi:hypothetical protein
MIDNLEEKLADVLRRRFGDATHISAEEFERLESETMKRVTDRMRSDPSLMSNVADLIFRGEIDAASELLGRAFDGALRTQARFFMGNVANFDSR